MTGRLTLVSLFLMLHSAPLDACRSYGQTPSFAKEGELIFASAGGALKSRIDVEVAETEEERTTGLMYRTALQENQGMLFIFPDEDMRVFWMKNTPLPLDILFVNADGVILTIQQNAVPYAEASIPSLKPARYVVEVNAGYTKKFAVRVGDKIYWQRM